MRRAVTLMWIGLVLPLGLAAVNGGPDGWLPHVFFHPSYIAFLAVGGRGALLLRRTARSRTLRGVAGGALVVAAVAAAGHATELAVVISEGGLSVNESVFEAPWHLAAASVTAPMVLLAVVLTLAATVGASAQARGRSRGALSHAVRVTHRWSSVLLVLTVPLLLGTGAEGWPANLAVALLVTLLLTGLQMSVRHYTLRLRRHALRRGQPTPNGSVALAARPSLATNLGDRVTPRAEV